ncbi:MAG: phenylacetate--CoA ligase family protein [Clostridiales bacterium]|jgi:phenylacetate-CoA ligase|nr:phenylacetate--CoA ligase family protein [Clostridiales bacterium]
MKQDFNTPILDKWIAEKIGLAGKPLNRRALEMWQLKALNRVFELTHNSSPFFRERFGKVCLSSLNEMAYLPFTTPDDLLDNPLKMLCASPGEISRIVSLPTSGSTGPSKRVFFTQEDQELCIDFFHHGMRLLVDGSDTVGILFPAKTPGSVGDLLRKGLERIGARSLTLFEAHGDPQLLANLFLSEKVTSLAGPTSVIKSLADFYLENSELTRPGIKSVLLSAEYVSTQSRKSIGAAWGAEVFEHYGMTEMGFGCAVSCREQLKDPENLGYHIREGDIYIEIIDPETGMPQPDGQEGEIVFTTLTRRGMPFIRYRTGDFSRLLTRDCPCGSVLKLLGRVGDRKIKKGYIT